MALPYRLYDVLESHPPAAADDVARRAEHPGAVRYQPIGRSGSERRTGGGAAASRGDAVTRRPAFHGDGSLLGGISGEGDRSDRRDYDGSDPQAPAPRIHDPRGDPRGRRGP